ncbi:putative transmembrane protein [Toxoplasma gondii RUB]|uniref:Transmembrane protein n=9 Tax=Toxoplasma gondii TaxID=5811 RepID=S7WHE7_TOXGG|nr:hypothetical protein TGGT1_245550 [Toxoplasma gondii GT1]KAF4638409.1 hypothetical protein TGRH88_060170 [Toxoplasma gondii]KFG33884.1 putative transmembrane protein [Toxoplasma gondii FOU]KFG47628.1 putative transmembrane protein [Toxoplasma gondii p89]KFG64669.1 putative transmembrane protein [Toxoplasma gondii RUB]KFH04152.1 putative transmembrane protein [Toxoplasma gondii MAS]KFH12597.1 putative transmembrane protein [Toxoplasma gondii VAND]PUA90432.1 putative transmembrane protein [
MRLIVKSIWGLDLASWVALVSLYNLLSATVELWSESRRSCHASGADSLATFNFTSSVFTVLAGTLGILSTIFYSASFVIFVLVAVSITTCMDIAEIVTNATSANPSVMQFVMTGLHLTVTVVALLILFSYYRILKAGGTGREYRVYRKNEQRSQAPPSPSSHAAERAAEESPLQQPGSTYGATLGAGIGLAP